MFRLSNLSWMMFLLLMMSTAHASGGGTGMPWESGLQAIQESLTGPVAKAIALIGIVGSGAMLIWGGEISGFLKSVVYVVLVICLILGGNILINTVFTGSSALLPDIMSAEQTVALSSL